MYRKSILITAASAVVVAALAGVTAATAASAPDAVGLAGNGTKLVRFVLADPDSAPSGKLITGLSVDTALIGIDYRVQDGKLYGVGNEGGIYILSPGMAVAALQERPRVELDDSGAFGVDFNPAANALRIVSAQGTNLRVPFATAAAAITDGPLTRPVVPPATGTEPATGVAGAAYTNNDLDATTATTLFVLDTERDQVALQSPANSGSTVPTGALGRDVDTTIGFDIFSDLTDDKTSSNLAYAVVDGQLRKVNLLTGSSRPIGKIGVNRVTDLAIALD